MSTPSDQDSPLCTELTCENILGTGCPVHFVTVVQLVLAWLDFDRDEINAKLMIWTLSKIIPEIKMLFDCFSTVIAVPEMLSLHLVSQ